MPVKTVQRYDKVNAPNWMVTPFSRNLDGALIGRACITNVGIFEYRNADGSIRRELRLPEEVFSRASVDSLKMCPITNDHPPEFVTPENIDQYQIGTMGSNPSMPSAYSDGEPSPYRAENGVYDGQNGHLPDSDRYHLACDAIISKSDGITDVVGGKVALSAGYTVELEETPGVWMGMNYDVIQRNIRYNHVAVVDEARAGDAARIILRQDSADAMCISQCEVPKTKGGNNMPVKTRTVNVDGVDYDLPEHVAVKYDSMRQDLKKAHDESKDAKDALSTAEAKLDNAESKIEALGDELKEAKDTAVSPETINKAVKARKVVEDAAKLAKVEFKQDDTNDEIKKAVIMKVYGKKDEKDNEALSKKLDDAVYRDGRFDGAIDQLKSSKKNSDTNTQKLDENLDEESFEHEDSKELEKARLDSEKDTTEAWKRSE